MESKLLFIVVAVAVIAIAGYLAFMSSTTNTYVPPTPKPPVQAPMDAQALLLNTTAFGKDLGDYVYSFNDSFGTNFTLTSSGPDKKAVIEEPISTQTVYFMSNDTIFCVGPESNATCQSVQDNASLTSYLDYVQGKFFNQTSIDGTVSTVGYLMQQGYLSVDPIIINETIGTIPCSLVSYVIDFRNMSATDAESFGLSSNSPMVMNLSNCIDPKTGLTYRSTLDYTDSNGTSYGSTISVLYFKQGTVPISPPNGTYGNAIGIFSDELTAQATLSDCQSQYTNKSQMDMCVAEQAVELERKDLCNLIPDRRDQCLVSLIPLTKDVSICPTINDPSFKDDCYIELAGAYKNNSYCVQVLNASKMPECQNASIVVPVNVTINSTLPVNGSAVNATTSSTLPMNGSSANSSSTE